MHNGRPFQEPFPLFGFRRVVFRVCSGRGVGGGCHVGSRFARLMSQTSSRGRTSVWFVRAQPREPHVGRRALWLAASSHARDSCRSRLIHRWREAGRKREKAVLAAHEVTPLPPPRACATPSLPGLALSVLAAWFCFGGDVGVVMMLRPPKGARLQHGSLPGRGEKNGRGTMI